MKNLTNIFQLSLLAVLLCAAGLFISSAANAQQCDLCQMAADGNLRGIQTRCAQPGSANLTQSKDDEGRTALLHAARRDQTDVVKALLNGVGQCSPANPHSPNYNQRTPLMWAAQNGNIDVGMALVTKMIALTDSQTARRQVNHLKNDGRTAADIALQYEQRDFLVELVVRGGGMFRFREHNPLTNSSVIELLGRSPMAQTKKARDILTAILDSWNTNPPFGGYSSLAHWAFSPDSGSAGPAFYLPLARELLPFNEVQNIGYVNASVAFQSLVTHRQRSLEDALTFAARTGNATLIRILLQMGANIEYVSDSPAIPAGRNYLYSIVTNPLLPSTNGTFTPLVHAAYHGHIDAVRVLLDRGADALYSGAAISSNQFIRREGSGYTPLMAAARMGRVEIVELLLAHDSSNINQLDDSSSTALDIAVRFDSGAYSNWNLRAMASVFIRHPEINVNNAILIAALRSNWYGWGDTNQYLGEVVQILLTHNSVDTTFTGNYGQTALHYAASRGGFQTIDALLAAGASVDSLNDRGNTPLHEGLYWYVGPTTQYVIPALMRGGADADALNLRNETPLHMLNYAGRYRRYYAGGEPVGGFPEAVVAMLDAQADPAIGLGGGAFLYAMRNNRSDIVNAYLNHYSLRYRRDLIGTVLHRLVEDLLQTDEAIIREQESNLRLLVRSMADSGGVNVRCSSVYVPTDTGNNVPFVSWAKAELLTSTSAHVSSLNIILADCPGWNSVVGSVAGASGAGGDRIIVTPISSINDEEFDIPEEDDLFLLFNHEDFE